ncbi:MAG: ATP-binding cassette domain-containing protein [Phycisphaeraceae bacterium]|nr:ATP-binding cassette domain-containing protein [Phycisphaerales bacterium]MCB9859369.1 ATP-binding cassette domain-containing protein [Phycisphaeraceae bacterium]
MATHTESVRFAEAIFGLDPDTRDSNHQRRLACAYKTAERIDRILKFGQIALITGPSGSGKSLIARSLFDILQKKKANATWITSTDSDIPAVEVVASLHRSRANHCTDSSQTLVQAMRTMARAGLAEAALFGTPARSLSDGQRARLALAAGVASTSNKHGTLIADEFCSTLDRTTAACVSTSITRWIRASRCARMVCASAHHDLLAMLNPDWIVIVEMNGLTHIEHRNRHGACRRRSRA